MSTIAAALQAARQKIAASEARLLLRHALSCSAAHIEAHREDALDPTVEEGFEELVQRRLQGEPVAYLMQTREFYGRPFAIAPGVLIPRPETELILDIVLDRFDRDANLRVLDMGTGSGCLAVTLSLELPNAAVTALDFSREALDIAAQNAKRLGAQVRFLESDWFSSVENEKFDLIVSNPPYIASDDPHLGLGDLRFEPELALTSGKDGLDAIRHIVGKARDCLTPGGGLLFEHGYDQAASVQSLLEEGGFCGIEQHRDINSIIRVSGGRRDTLRK